MNNKDYITLYSTFAAGRIDRCDPFQIAAVGEIGDDERREADEES